MGPTEANFQLLSRKACVCSFLAPKVFLTDLSWVVNLEDFSGTFTEKSFVISSIRLASFPDL